MEQSKFYDNVKLISDETIFKIYQVLFPHTSSEKIVLGFIDLGLRSEEVYLVNSRQEWIVQKVKDLKQWVRMLAVRKALSRFGIGEGVKSQQMYCFDGIISSYQNQQLGLYVREHLTPIPKEQLQGNTRQRVKRNFLSVLADYHSQNIILRSVSGGQLMWKQQEVFLRVNENVEVARYDEGHWEWMEQGQDPYALDRSLLEQVLNGFSPETSSEDNYFQTLKQNASYLFQQISLLKSLFQSSFNQFKKRYQIIKKTPFIISKNKRFADDIQEYLLKTDRKAELNAFLEQKLAENKQRINSNWESLAQVEELLFYRRFNQTQINSPSNINAFSKIEHLIIAQISHYQYYSFKMGRISSKESLMPSDLSEKKSLKSQNEVLLWHFLRAKAENKKGKYYRALSHLKQASKLAKDMNTEGVLQLEKGRNWELLNLHTKAEQCYQRSKKIRSDLYGKLHPMVLLPLYNILQLSLKEYNCSKIDTLKSQIEEIKKHLNKDQKLQWNKLGLFWTIDQFEKEKEDRKAGSKQILIKVQSARMPFIDQLWQYSKKLFQKGKQSAIDLNSHFRQPFINYFCYPSAILIVINSFMQSDYEIPSIVLSRLQYILRILKRTNLKNYNRLLYCLSFVWEKQGQYSKAIKALQQIDHTSLTLYNGEVQVSIKRRLLTLYKKSKNNKKIVKFYLEQDMTKWGDINEFYPCLKVLQEQGEGAKCMRLARYYLDHIHQYSPSLDDIFSVQVILVKVYLQLRNYQEALNLVKVMQKEEIRKQEIGSLLLILAESAIEGKEWGIARWALQQLLGFNSQVKQDSKQNRYQISIPEKFKISKMLIKIVVELKLKDFSIIHAWLTANLQGKRQVMDKILTWKDLQLLLMHFPSESFKEL